MNGPPDVHVILFVEELYCIFCTSRATYPTGIVLIVPLYAVSEVLVAPLYPLFKVNAPLAPVTASTLYVSMLSIVLNLT